MQPALFILKRTIIMSIKFPTSTLGYDQIIIHNRIKMSTSLLKLLLKILKYVSLAKNVGPFLRFWSSTEPQWSPFLQTRNLSISIDRYDRHVDISVWQLLNG